MRLVSEVRLVCSHARVSSSPLESVFKARIFYVRTLGRCKHILISCRFRSCSLISNVHVCTYAYNATVPEKCLL